MYEIIYGIVKKTTELLTPPLPNPTVVLMSLSGDSVPPIAQAINIGLSFDLSFTLTPHFQSICKLYLLCLFKIHLGEV